MITIHKATPEHLDTLIHFQQQLALESENIELSSDDLRKGMVAMFQDTSKGIYYLAFDDEDIVGCHMITTEWSDWRNGMVWWLQSVYVKQSHRKMGVFKKMFDNVMSLINNDPTLIGLRLYVDKTNTRAMTAYEAMGMDGSHYTVYEKMK
jgi:GNAT superfamily N-acetyltransferase